MANFETAPLFSRPLAAEAMRAARAGLALEDAATPEEREAIASAYDLIRLDSLAYVATLEPFMTDGWRLSGRLAAVATQRCVVTLEPVVARLDEPFERLWRPSGVLEAKPDAAASMAAGATSAIDALARGEDGTTETAWPGDGTDDVEIDPLPETIDPAAAALESFTLALDPYPRAPGARFAGAAHGPPGAEPLSDDAAKPFKGLEALRARMAEETESDVTGRPSAKDDADE